MICPYCGSKDVAEDLTDWTIQSIEDPSNKGVVPEHQCKECGASFWCDRVEEP
jgi:hypothetical protein